MADTKKPVVKTTTPAPVKEALKTLIIKELKDWKNKEEVETFGAYCQKLLVEKNKDNGSLKNPWFQGRSPSELAEVFKRVANDGLVFDGKHVTFQSTGVSYDYVAYKNKMLKAYPESKIDIGTVAKEDEVSFEKVDGTVIYRQIIKNPFASPTEETIIGAFCVIKNSRGDFLTTLSKEEIEKHRKVARTDFIWKAWFKEMVLKTVIKKACKQHFDDVTAKMDEVDNENNDITNPLDLELQYKQEIDQLDTLEELDAYRQANSGKGKDVDTYLFKRAKAIKEGK